jgi:DNA-binding response OmpR family regulator
MGRAGTTSPGDFQGVHVLVVEDQWQVALALKSFLEAHDMKVSGPVAKLADASRLAAEHTPVFAIVDMNLKGDMAYPLIDQLHDQGVRVVVISGYAVVPQLGEKVVAVLQKPFDGAELLAVFRGVLSASTACDKRLLD